MERPPSRSTAAWPFPEGVSGPSVADEDHVISSSMEGGGFSFDLLGLPSWRNRMV